MTNLKKHLIPICLSFIFFFTTGFFYANNIEKVLAATPTSTTGSATSITNTTVTVNGAINPNGNSVSYWFFYYPDGRADLTKSTTWTSLGDTGTANVSVSANISSLTSGTKYHYYISAKNDTADAYLPNSALNNFTTTGGASPTVTTGSATSIADTTATINGAINPNGNSVYYQFFYYPNGRADLTKSTTWTSLGNTGTSNVSINASISSLTLGTTYNYYISAKNDTAGEWLPNSVVKLFTTTGGIAPTVTTDPATSIADTTATVNGTINPNGHTIGYLFFYKKSTDTTYTGTTWSSAGNGTSNVTVSANISSLTPGTIYTYYIDAFDYTDNIYRLSSIGTFTTTGTLPPLSYGIAEARPYFEPGYEINNIVGVRYKFKIERNDGVSGKIIFGSSRLRGSGSDTYLIERNIYNSKVSYFDPVCSGGWEQLNIMTVGQSTLRVAVPDYVGAGKTGLKTGNTTYFPRITYLIDAIAGLVKTDVISQDNLNGKEGMVETLRGDIVSDKTGWKCGGVNLDSDIYRQWNINTSINGSLPYNVSIALPETGAKYLTYQELINFRTEFFQKAGLFKVYFWDFEFKREGGLIWEPLINLKVSDYDGDTKNFGIKKIIYNGKNAIEISNDNPTPTAPVFFVKDVKFELSPSPATVSTIIPTNISATGVTLKGTIDTHGTTNLYYKFCLNNNWWCTDSWSVPSSTSINALSVGVTSLSSGTTYSYTLVVMTSSGTTLTTSNATSFKTWNTFSVTKTGSGSGTVTAGGINCGSTCSSSFPPGTIVFPQVAPASGSVFTGWKSVEQGGDCPSTALCPIRMSNKNITATANFESSKTLTVNKTKNVAGTVTSSPTGIKCGISCDNASKSYSYNTTVILKAFPSTSYNFSSWSGCNSSSLNSCTVKINSDKTVTANFTLKNKSSLKITKSGKGTGYVTISKTGLSDIKCEFNNIRTSSCTGKYANDGATTITLKASPNSGSEFAGWGGACAGKSNCSISQIGTGKNVTAYFNKI